MLFFLYLHLNMNELFIYHNIFLLQTEGPSLSVRGSKSVCARRCLWRLHSSLFYRRSKSIWWRASTAQGCQPFISVLRLKSHEATIVALDHIHRVMASAFWYGIPGQLWSIFVQTPPQGTSKQRGWSGSQPFHFLILARRNVYLWLLSLFPVDQASASWKRK